MSFNLYNSLSTFMHLMIKILKALFGWYEVVYFDDILLYNKLLEEHL